MIACEIRGEKMKSNKGFTLVSVIVYIVCLILAMSTVMMMNSFYFADVIQMRGVGELANQYNRFNMFFIEDMRQASDVDVIDDSSNNKTIQIAKKDRSDGEIIYINYIWNNNSIYRNDVKIAENIFSLRANNIVDNIQEGNSGIEVHLVLSLEEQTLSYITNYYVGRGY